MKKITLTFDNGPDPEATPFVLDVLARHGIKTTFFVLGEKLRDASRRSLCERAHAEGHWIGNHTFNHITPLGLSRSDKAPFLEISRTQGIIGDLAHPMKLFRPFGGGGNLDTSLLDSNALQYLVQENYTCVLWNVVPRDWEDPEGWVQVAIDQCREQEWPLVVLHDLATAAMPHLEKFIVHMKDDGAEFVQEFPKDCVPIVEGRIVAPMEGYVSEGLGHRA